MITISYNNINQINVLIINFVKFIKTRYKIEKLSILIFNIKEILI